MILKNFLKYQSISVGAGAGWYVCRRLFFIRKSIAGVGKILGVQIPSKLAQGELMNGEMFRFLLI